jgi:hypothetical protein
MTRTEFVCNRAEPTGTAEPTPPSPPPSSPFALLRDDVLDLGTAMGQLAAIVRQSFPLDTVDDEVTNKQPPINDQKAGLSPFQQKLSEMWSLLVRTASHLSLHLPECTYKKIELNRKKYPAAMCKVRCNILLL